MYRIDYSSYDKYADTYAVRNEVAEKVKALPNDLNGLRIIFEDSYKNHLSDMFDRALRKKGDADDDSNLQYSYVIKIGWHTPFEILFEAMGMGISTGFKGNEVDAMHYESIIGAMLTAKYGKPIGFRLDKLLQVAQLMLESYPNFYNIFISVCYYYGHYEALIAQDKKGNLRKKQIERKAKIEEINHNFSEIIEFLCPKLNGRLVFHKINNEKPRSDEDLKKAFYPLKLFTVLLDKNTTEIDHDLAEPNSKEIFDLIKHYLKLRSYNNFHYNFDGINESIIIKILHFLHCYCDFACKNDWGLYTRSYDDSYANIELDNFIKLANLLELNDYIVDGMYDDRNDESLHLNYTFDVLDESDRYGAKHKLNQALQFTISQYVFEGGYDHGRLMYDGRYRFESESKVISENTNDY